MTDWGEGPTRHDLWLQLMSLTDELRYVADQWLSHDLEVRELQLQCESMPAQYELPLVDDEPTKPMG